MSSGSLRHPGEDELLRYADGELPAREAAVIRSHLEACWQCRTASEELQKTVRECVRYNQDVLAAYLPPPPAPWSDLSRRFDAVDASLPSPSFAVRFMAAARFPGRRELWLPATVALLILLGVVYQLRHTPSVRAAELLRKAVAAADSHPVSTRRIQIRTSRQRVTRIIASAQPNPDARAASLHERETLASLQALFEEAHYSWEDPLSARSYRAWHDRLPDSLDEVTEDRNEYRIRTTTNSGELRQATLRLSAHDLRPLEGTLHFRNHEWVEIRELAEELPVAAVAKDAKTSNVEAAEPGVAPQSIPGLELQVMAALHGIGADLGDPVEVTRVRDRVLVLGAGVDPARRQQIQRALASLPRVEVRFAESPAETPAGKTDGLGTSPPGSDTSELQARLERQFGGAQGYEQFVAAALDLSDTMMSRAYALRALAQRFPEDVESGMSTEDRTLLNRLRQAHAGALTQRAIEMQRLAVPVLTGLGASATGNPVADAGAASRDTWQRQSDDLFRSAKRVEMLAAALLGGAPADTPVADLPSRFLASLAGLRAKSESYERLIGRSAGGNH